MPFVSGIRIVEKMPVNMKKANISKLTESLDFEIRKKNICSHMLHEFAFTTDILKLRETDLSHNGTKLAGSGRDTVGSGTVPGGENLTRDDEGCGIGTKVLEEVGKAV